MQFVQLLPEKTALFQVVQQHLLTFEQQWTEEASGRTLPKFVLVASLLGPTSPTPAPHGLAAPVAQLHPARPPPREAGGGDDWVN